MTPTSAITEFLKMSPEELHREVKTKRASIAKKRLHLELKKEKNSAAFRSEKKDLARMLTVANQKRPQPLQKKPSSPKVSAPKS